MNIGIDDGIAIHITPFDQFHNNVVDRATCFFANLTLGEAKFFSCQPGQNEAGPP